MKFYNLKLALRNARNNATLSTAKLFGICLSFSVILFAAGYAYYHISFDRFIPDSDRIFRCLMTGELNSREADFAVTAPAMAAAVTAQVPKIEEAIRMKPRGEANFRYNDKVIEGGDMVVADSNLFSFFGFPVVTDRDNPLATGKDLVISKSLAITHFGSVQEALNEVVELRGDQCVITGVFDDLPQNCHLQFQLIRSISTTNPQNIGWGSQSYYTYIKTNTPDVDLNEMKFKLTKCVYQHSAPDGIDANSAQTMNDLRFNESSYIFYPIEPLKDIHFSNHRFNMAVTANKTYVYGAIILAVMVLLISSINYINLTIANLSTRFKEIGIRKTNGAFSKQIALQFMYETVVFWFIGFVFAVLIYFLLSKPLADYLNLEIHLTNITIIKLLGFSFILLLLFNALVNFLPISLISGKKVIHLVKEENKTTGHFSLKDSFVFIQFVLSALIILSSIFVNKQINYMVHKDRGYDSDNIIMFNLLDLTPERRAAFTNELKTHSAVQSVSSSNQSFGTDPGMTSAYFETDEDMNYFHTTQIGTDPEFINTFGINMLEGRYFNKDLQTDENAIVINKAAADEYPGTGSLIGKEIIVGQPYKVIGITENFNFRSLHHEIAPLIMLLDINDGFIYVKTAQNQVQAVTQFIEQQWAKFNIDRPFNYTFHDDVLAEQYQNDQQAKKMLLVLSVISILIACVGLYAISFFTILKKTKEFAIRKINGARIMSIAYNISERFFILVVGAFLLAIPICFIFIKKWLQNFAFKTTLDWWVFVVAIGITIAMAVISILWHVYLAATRNPVEALRYE